MFYQNIRYNIFKYTVWIRWFLLLSIAPLIIIVNYSARQFPDIFEPHKIKRLIISSIFLAFFIILYNLFFIYFEKLRKNKDEIKNYILKSLCFLIYNFVFDIISASWLIYNSGGSSSMLIIVFFLIILFAAATHPPKTIAYLGIFSFLILNLIFFLDQSGIFPAIDFFYADKGFSFPGIFVGLANLSFDIVFSAGIFISVIISKTIHEKEESLTKERDRVELLIENMKDGIIVIDPKNYIIFINKIAAEIFGLDKKEVLNRQITLEMFDDAKLKNLARAVLIKENEENNFKPAEIQVLTPKPSIIQTYSINILEKGEIVSTMKVLRDISREKEIEKLKSEFIFVAAHQLRTPLSAIKWVFSMILDGDTGKINEEQKDLLGKGMFSTKRMIELVNDLLNVSRIEEGKFDYNFEICDLEDIIKKVLIFEEGKIKEKEINLNFITEKENGGMPKIKADKEKLPLVFQNIIENAINYSFKKGGIVITIKKEGTNLLAEIKDNGVGIPKDQINRLFNKFFRGNNVIRMQTEGTGLGLFIAKNIVERHGGKIEIISEESKGTKVLIHLPILNNSEL